MNLLSEQAVDRLREFVGIRSANTDGGRASQVKSGMGSRAIRQEKLSICAFTPPKWTMSRNANSAVRPGDPLENQDQAATCS